jgi:hypothetical protein
MLIFTDNMIVLKITNKMNKYLLPILGLLFTFSLSFSSCTSSSEKSKENIEQDGKEYTSAYVCPMHCEGSGDDKPGKCPVCNMDYVINEKVKKDQDHNHDGHDHDGHNHDGHNH